MTDVQDPDSLRFALGILDYDVAALRPHFPGYPVFMAIVMLFHAMSGSISAAFTIVGGIATYLLCKGALRAVNAPLASPEGVLMIMLILFNPLIWTMGNRFMPDLLGAAVVVWIFTLLVRRDPPPGRDLIVGLFLTGLLAGIRLSYLPLVIVPMFAGLKRSGRWGSGIAALLLGLLLWLIPLAVDTGLPELYHAADRQAEGHFEDFGGTIETIPDIDVRRTSFLQGMIADGLGGWWPGRALLTIITSIGLIILFARGLWWLFDRETDGILIGIISLSLYIGWIILYQNIVYQPRHILPIVPFVLMIAWAGGQRLMRGSAWERGVVILVLCAYALTGIVLALQGREPTAIAQVARYLRADSMSDSVSDSQSESVRDRHIVSTDLICDYLRLNGVEGTYHIIDPLRPACSRLSRELAGVSPLYVIGWFDDCIDHEWDRRLRFRHNPFVNAVWPEIPVAIDDGDSGDVIADTTERVDAEEQR